MAVDVFHPESALGELTDDALTGAFRVYQRKHGHRYSLDDTLTAWEALQAAPNARRVLDLGCGIGSVLLMAAYKLPNATLAGVEAQALSFDLAQRNVARNGVASRVTLHHGDLRDPRILVALQGQTGGGYDLVTGTPPYQPKGNGTVSPDSQRAHARVELRGGIEAYLESAARLVAPGGRVVLCGDARSPERVHTGALRSGLRLLSERRVWPAASYKQPLFSVWTLSLAGEQALAGEPAGPANMQQHPDWFARDAAGNRTPEALALRAFFDLRIDNREPASPRVRPRSQGLSARDSDRGVAYRDAGFGASETGVLESRGCGAIRASTGGKLGGRDERA